MKSKNVPEVEFKPLLLHTGGLDTYDIYLSLVGGGGKQDLYIDS